MAFNPQPKPEPTPKKKRKRIAYRSTKRAAEEREYSNLRVDFLDKNRICQVCNNSRAVQVHHKSGRIGSLLNDVSKFLATCHDCHEKIENNPLWALEEGYSIHRL